MSRTESPRRASNISLSPLFINLPRGDLLATLEDFKARKSRGVENPGEELD